MDLEAAMITALSDVAACTMAAFEQDEYSLPLVVVSLDDRRVTARADGAPYLEEAEVSAFVYARDRDELLSLCGDVDEALTGLGFSRMAEQHTYETKTWAHEKRLRYRAVLRGDTIYQ